MEEEKLREKYIYYIRNKRRKKFYKCFNNKMQSSSKTSKSYK